MVAPVFVALREWMKFRETRLVPDDEVYMMPSIWPAVARLNEWIVFWVTVLLTAVLTNTIPPTAGPEPVPVPPELAIFRMVLEVMVESEVEAKIPYTKVPVAVLVL